MAKSSSISSSASSLAKEASVSAASAASVASASLSSATSKASAAAADAMGTSSSSGMSKTGGALTTIAVIITLIVVGLTGLYFSGYADDVFEYYIKKYYKAKAKAEVATMEKMGEGQAQDFLKGQLKKNPVLGEDELEGISSGLGKEASAEGLGGVSDKLGGLGKL